MDQRPTRAAAGSGGTEAQLQMSQAAVIAAATDIAASAAAGSGGTLAE